MSGQLDAAVAAYRGTCEELGRRILALIPLHPEILDVVSPWDLIGVPGFVCSDLSPSLAQVGGALSWAKRQYRREAARRSAAPTD